MTTLRLFYDYFIVEITTIGYDYSRSCYDYFSPLLAIGRKPEKSCGGSRQWFRSARRTLADGMPSRVEGARLTQCALTSDQRQIANRRTDPVMETLTPQQVRRV